MLENSINNIIDSTPLLARSIEKDIDAAKTHIDNHVSPEEQILTLDKNCEYCQIYFKE
jgi:predicted oxidoreductase